MTPTKKLLIAATALASIGAISVASSFAQNDRPAASEAPMMKPVRSLSVTGNGDASAKPDMATINFSVEARGDTAADALKGNNIKMNAAMNAIKRAGIADRDMQTTGLYMNTQNVRGPDGSWSNEIDYYEARNTLTVKVRDIDDAGEVIDAAVEAGINGLGGISYGFSDDAELMEQARKSAVADARAKAELYAAEAGVDLGDILYIAEPGSYSGPQPEMITVSAMRASDQSTKIAAGENTVSAQINVVFSIK